MKKIIIFTVILLVTVLSSNLVAQNKNTNDPLRIEAQSQMKAGRYGEAIDLLNRYISANPQKADGYNLRGLCNEKRAQYEQAVYDFRSARKLEPNNKEINQNLARTTDAWYKLLYNKIEGHKREIAINPNIARNYLEIGKSYKNLGEWPTAEVWYDEYLKREEASADEIIRYTEILAKNGHIKKGEPILKRYTDMYPEDHRLWSRYGYFLLWLGKIKPSIEAFENALALRPFFREAMDGLDLAKGKGYIYTINDTSVRHNYGMPVASGTEYAIDKYYRLLKRNPNDNQTRYKLIEELVKNQRYGEAFDQIEIIERDSTYTDRISEYRETVKAIRDSIYEEKIVEYTRIIENDPSNKEAVMQLADYYGGMMDYDTALEIMDKYLASVPAGQSKEVRYKYAQFSTWNYQFEPAIEQLDMLLEMEPDNLTYQLLRGQIAAWTVQDMEQGEVYLNNVLKADPNSIPALTSLASMKIRQKEFDTAKELLDKATALDPESKQVEAIQIYYDVSLSNEEGLRIYQILYDARDLVAAGDCPGAIEKYDDYFSKISGPTRLEQIEYANVNVCAENYQTALDMYDRLLQEEYDYELAIMRGKAYLWVRDSVKALEEFTRLVAENPDNFDAKLNLAVAYEYNHEFGEADDIYDELLEVTEDTAQIAMLEQRKSWISAASTSWSPSFGSFPSHIAFSPIGSYYKDNQDFQFHSIGGRAEFGITSFLTLGTSLNRTTLDTRFTNKNLTVFKWQVFLRPVDKLWINTGFGTLNIQNELKRNVMDAVIRYENPERFMLNASYENTDARLILYSPNLVNVAFDADLYRLQGYYQDKSGVKLSGHFSYITIQDGNRGNDLMLRIGKKFYEAITFGYEYTYANYLRNSFFYYSPQSFDSHSLWADWAAVKNQTLALTFGGRLGYVPKGDYIIREAYGDVTYNPLPYLFLAARVTVGSTYRYASSYNFVSAFVSAYISFH
ncbi:MAG: tetratricopeptide repeat protein [Ignavibacteriaceae bacterium]